MTQQKRARDSMLSKSRFKDFARVFDPEASIQGLPDWDYIPTPGHVSFIRPGDRVLITGDALVTVNLNSLLGFLLWGFRRNKQGFSGPPWYTIWSWQAAKQSIASIARVKPLVLATGHGLPMTGSTTARDVRAFADRVR
jgi:glyoxylase-like metal-dependent hydrolase (beta-lactamase superfamily II)